MYGVRVYSHGTVYLMDICLNSAVISANTWEENGCIILASLVEISVRYIQLVILAESFD